MQAQKLPRGASGTAFRNPVHVLDAANYVKLAWDTIASTTIKNTFRMAEILPKVEDEDIVEDEVDYKNNGMFANLMVDLQSLNIEVTEQEIEEFL
jgi:hypothetical protein